MRRSSAFVLIFVLLSACLPGERRVRREALELYRGERGCLPCHARIVPMNVPNHNYSCETCHAGNAGTRSAARAHKGLIAHPQDVPEQDGACYRCHLSAFDPDPTVEVKTSYVRSFAASHAPPK